MVYQSQCFGGQWVGSVAVATSTVWRVPDTSIGGKPLCCGILLWGPVYEQRGYIIGDT